jgi:hypothetical protein
MYVYLTKFSQPSSWQLMVSKWHPGIWPSFRFNNHCCTGSNYTGEQQTREQAQSSYKAEMGESTYTIKLIKFRLHMNGVWDRRLV